MQIAYDREHGWAAALDIPYRGKRVYLHGTDLYSAASQIVSGAAGSSLVTRLDVRFPKFSRNSGILRLVESDPDRERLQLSPVRIHAACDDGRLLVGWYEESETRVQRRAENCEAAIVAATEIEGEIARYTGEQGPPIIEIIVFVTKTLLLKLFPDGPGKWVFTALRSESLLPDGFHAIQVVLTSAVGSRAASCSVMCGPEMLGEIYFAKADE